MDVQFVLTWVSVPRSSELSSVGILEVELVQNVISSIYEYNNDISVS